MMALLRRVAVREERDPGVEPLVDREWIVTNGLGGYASGSIAGVATRRYHGLLVAALPGPLGRMLMLSHLVEEVHEGAECYPLTAREHVGGLTDYRSGEGLNEFRLEQGLPVWS